MAADANGSKQPPKTIILFSDGTANTSGKLHKTNVWRMYQAVDLGVPQTADQRVQIGRYDNGIGTSAFRLLAMIQGIFGWGLKRNILSLYLFLCRNYRPEDSICLFGFSRGAFTMRVLADLIDKQGIISWKRGEALDYLVREAYRAYRQPQRPRMWPMRGLIVVIRWLAGAVRNWWRVIRRRERYEPDKKLSTKVAFLGVWDTVGAYGGPIVELVRAVDDWIMPISFTDKSLPACVEVARHALALDDERDSFQPLPWDETHETKPDRLKQAWFAGMHSDVGGGYPDDSLAYVSFIWMLDEAECYAHVRFRPDRRHEARLQADAFGPIHDSRAGLGGYYRYQPRKIGALMSPPEAGTRSLIDPEQPTGQGMVRPIQLHDSVIRRILSGTDGYAPITVPRQFEIVQDIKAPTGPMIPPADRARFADKEWQATRARAQRAVWDGVWWRRVFYFGIVLASLALAVMPLFMEARSSDHESGEFAEVLQLPLASLRPIAPSLAHPWLDTFIARPWLTALILIVIVVLFKSGNAMEKRMRAKSRLDWHVATGAKAPKASLVYRLRTNRTYQRGLTVLRWDVLPALFGLAALALMAVLITWAMTRTRLELNAQNDMFCQNKRPQRLQGDRFWMSTDEPCNLSPFRILKGRTYRVELEVPRGHAWRDGSVDATPNGGIATGALMAGGLDRLFVGTRRVLGDPWMQPLAYVVGTREGRPGSVTQPLRMSHIAETDDYDRYSATFKARSDGNFAIAVNEAVPPWPLRFDYFYRSENPRIRNSGGGCVRLVPQDKAEAARWLNGPAEGPAGPAVNAALATANALPRIAARPGGKSEAGQRPGIGDDMTASCLPERPA